MAERKRFVIVNTFDPDDLTLRYFNSINRLDLLVAYSEFSFRNNTLLHSAKGNKAIRTIEADCPRYIESETWDEMDEVNTDIGTYYVGYQPYYWGKQTMMVCRETDRIGDDDDFSWRLNQKYGSQETVISDDPFDFLCIVRADGNAFIDVYYTKCANKHRNRVCIERINVQNATNGLLKNAIYKWKNDFRVSLSQKS